MIDPDGPNERTIKPRLPGRISYFVTSPSDVMAVVGRSGGVAIVPPPDRPARRLESDWKPLAWSRDGRRLLAVNRSANRLGLMSPRDGSVEQVGCVRGGRVFQAAWVA